MGSRRIENNADQNVEGDKEASSAEKRLEKVHHSSHSSRGAPVTKANHASGGLAIVLSGFLGGRPSSRLGCSTLRDTNTCLAVSTIVRPYLSVLATLRSVINCRDT